MPVSTGALTEIPPCSAVAFLLERHHVLRIVDPCGEQVADLVAFAASDPREFLSNGRTFDYAGTVRLSTGHVLYSNRSNAMFTILRDDVGIHDFLLTPCSRDTWRICYGDESDDRPGCHGNLSAALAPYGVDGDAIPTTFNAFMNVRIDGDGSLAVVAPRSRPGDAIELRAECDVIVGLTACSAPASNNGRLKPIRYAVRSEVSVR